MPARAAEKTSNAIGAKASSVAAKTVAFPGPARQFATIPIVFAEDLHPEERLMNNVMLKSSTMVTATDYERLSDLVEVTRLSMPELSSYLERELERAKIVPQADPARVQMGSSVRFHDHGSDKILDIRLVYPAEASIAKGWLSVLTPVGSALLGRQAGSTALCRNLAGQVRPLTVMFVQPPDGAVQ